MESHERDWFSDQNYWEANRSFIWPEKRIEMSGIACEHISALLRMKPGDSILDLACGFGRHSLVLSGLGYSVTGVDLNPRFVAEAASKACEMGAKARFLCSDMREFVEDEAFDHIILLYNSFGYFQDQADDERVISNCFRSLRPGGKLLLQCTPRDLIKANKPSGHSRYWHEEADGAIRLEESVVNQEWTWHTTRWIVIRGSQRSEYSYGLRLYDSNELTDLLVAGGFSSVVPYGDLGGKPYEQGREFLTLVAEKN
jgi:SAM-dependent methyltransferase